MVGDILQPTHLLFVLVIALLVLGPKRLPEVGRALGRTMRDFRSAISGEDTHETISEAPPTVPVAAPPAPKMEDSASAESPPAEPTEAPTASDRQPTATK